MSAAAHPILTVEIDRWLLDKDPARFTDAAVIADAIRRWPYGEAVAPARVRVVRVYDHPRRPMRCYDLAVVDATTGQPVPGEGRGSWPSTPKSG